MASRAVLTALVLTMGLAHSARAADPDIRPSSLMSELQGSGQAAQTESALLASLDSSSMSGLNLGDASLLIVQQGTSNSASITTDYGNARAAIVQMGTGNSASISQMVLTH